MTTRVQNTPPILELGSDYYDVVTAAKFPAKTIRYWNDALNLNFDKDRLWDFQPLSGNIPAPLALKYHGHQFQHYNPDLGDGRGFLYAQILKDKQWYDLGTKGSGTTPYSRSGDGRLTLKGAVREALATEMLESLGVDTSRTACFFETGEQLQRNDEPSPTRSAVLTRFSRGHIRIGTFQRLAYFSQTDNIKKLTLYCLKYFYPDELYNLDPEDETLIASRFFSSVCQKNADLAAQVMMAGFVHGVLNTDNINVSGELFDYGPYRFLPTYDQSFTAAYFDHRGLYCYGRQPLIFMWNLNQLGKSLKVAYPDLPVEMILENFREDFNLSVQKHFQNRLNLKFNSEDNVSNALAIFFKWMDAGNRPFEKTFFDFHSLNPKRLSAYSGSDFQDVMRALEKAEVINPTKANHAYFQKLTPETLLIDEIETIWKKIADKDDWSLFNQKLQSIRELRGLLF